MNAAAVRDLTRGDDDAAVIRRVLDGDTQLFGRLVCRYQAALYRHAVGMVLDHDVAADMVQDAFVRAYASLRECRDARRFRAWLFQTLRHRCLDHLKDVRRRNVRLDDAGPLVDAREDPSAMVERQQLRTEIQRALMDLPDAQREAFVMRYVEGIPYETMADLLDASVSALKMRVLRAREGLAGALRPDVTEQPVARLSLGRRVTDMREAAASEEET